MFSSAGWLPLDDLRAVTLAAAFLLVRSRSGARRGLALVPGVLEGMPLCTTSSSTSFPTMETVPPSLRLAMKRAGAICVSGVLGTERGEGTRGARDRRRDEGRMIWRRNIDIARAHLVRRTPGVLAPGVLASSWLVRLLMTVRVTRRAVLPRGGRFARGTRSLPSPCRALLALLSREVRCDDRPASARASARGDVRRVARRASRVVSERTKTGVLSPSKSQGL